MGGNSMQEMLLSCDGPSMIFGEELIASIAEDTGQMYVSQRYNAGWSELVKTAHQDG